MALKPTWGTTTSNGYYLTDCTTTSSSWKTYATFKYTQFTEEAFRQVLRIKPGHEYDLPDGAKLIVDDTGNYRIEDREAKVTYKANRTRDFSPYMNASDMVGQFVDYVRQAGVKRDDVLGLPLKLFIAWLVIEAAERDGDDVPGDVLRIEQDPALKSVVKPRCLACGRFIPRLHCKHQFPFCNPEHGRAYASLALAN